MNKRPKDHISIYMFRNYLATLFIAFLSMIISLIQFYQCSIVEALQRLFFYDIYTLLYFLLLWLCDYLIFEISKILYDTYQNKFSLIMVVGLIGVCIGVFWIPFLDVFKWNTCFLCLLVMMRIGKEKIKKRPNMVYNKEDKL